jgi:hypothetical protein
MSTKPHHEPIVRALAHHESTRAITTWSSPEAGRPKWHVTMPNCADRLELTGREAWILCLGLARGEQTGRMEEARRAAV